MKLISIEAARSLWVDSPYGLNFRQFLNDLDTLPTISPIEVIEEMIEKESEKANRSNAGEYESGRVNSLEELLQKFKSLQ